MVFLWGNQENYNLNRRACTHEWIVAAPPHLNGINKPSRAQNARAMKIWDILKSTLKSGSLVTFETHCSTKSTTKVDSVILDNGQFAFSKAIWFHVNSTSVQMLSNSNVWIQQMTLNKKMLRQMRRLTNRNFFEFFCGVFISRTVVLYRKFISDSATTGTLNFSTFDEVDNSTRP